MLLTSTTRLRVFFVSCLNASFLSERKNVEILFLSCETQVESIKSGNDETPPAQVRRAIKEVRLSLQKRNATATTLGEKQQQSCLGFLTAFGDPREGVVGGFLVLNAAGRPLEFHCTAPVKPNRAQEILYGVSLEGFLCGEQIAPALVARTKAELALVLTNLPAMTPAYELLDAPLGLVFQRLQNANEQDDKKYAVWERREKNDVASPNAKEEPPREKKEEPFFYESLEQTPPTPGVDYAYWRETFRGRNRLALPVEFESQTRGKILFNELELKLDVFLKSIDSIEPFERVKLALEEARKSC